MPETLHSGRSMQSPGISRRCSIGPLDQAIVSPASCSAVRWRSLTSPAFRPSSSSGSVEKASAEKLLKSTACLLLVRMAALKKRKPEPSVIDDRLGCRRILGNSLCENHDRKKTGRAMKMTPIAVVCATLFGTSGGAWAAQQDELEVLKQQMATLQQQMSVLQNKLDAVATPAQAGPPGAPPAAAPVAATAAAQEATPPAAPAPPDSSLKPEPAVRA
ncbi:MAG: Major outer membrane protein [Massilia sp.]|nr:Major outer membrane protein [Massilia sp.]